MCVHSLLQTERAFQKQPVAFLNRKPGIKSSRPLRYVKEVGLGFKTPREAKEGKYVDKKCPFTGAVKIRGRILRGVVIKMKMQRTIVIRRDYLHYVRKYNRFEKRHRNMSVHLSPCFRLVTCHDVDFSVTFTLALTIFFTLPFHVCMMKNTTVFRHDQWRSLSLFWPLSYLATLLVNMICLVWYTNPTAISFVTGMLPLAMSSQLVNAGHFPRRFDSTFWRWPKLQELGSNSKSSSEQMIQP